MASILKVDTLTGVTTAGSISVTGEGNSTTTNLQQGLAKAWLKTNGSGTPTIGDSLNIASIVDQGVGDLQANFSNSFSNANYGGGACPISTAFAAMIQAIIVNSGYIYTKIHSDGAGGADGDRQIANHGDLA